jgi:hypothetical protein
MAKAKVPLARHSALSLIATFRSFRRVQLVARKSNNLARYVMCHDMDLRALHGGANTSELVDAKTIPDMMSRFLLAPAVCDSCIKSDSSSSRC